MELGVILTFFCLIVFVILLLESLFEHFVDDE